MSRRSDPESKLTQRRTTALTQPASTQLCSHKLIQVYQALSEFNQALLVATDEKQLFMQICRIAVEVAGAEQAWIAAFDHTAQRLKAVSYFPADSSFLSSLQNPKTKHFATAISAYLKNSSIIKNCGSSSSTSQEQLIIAQAACASFPIQRNKQPFAVLSLHSQNCSFFDQATLNLFEKTTQNLTQVLNTRDRDQQRNATLKALRSNEQHFRAYFERSLFGMVASRPDRSFIEVNPAFCEMLGYSAAELIGTKWDAQTHPEDILENQLLFQQLVDGSLDEFIIEKRFIKKSGEVIDAHLAVRAVRNADASLAYAFSLIEDITLRKMSERREQMRRRTLEKIAQGCSLQEIMLQLIESAEAIHPGSMCAISLTDETGKFLLHGAAPSLPDFFNQALDGVEIGLSAGSCAAAVALGKRVIVNKIASHPYWINHQALAAQAELNACWSEPIRSLSGAVLGCFTVYYQHNTSPDQQKIALIESAAKLLGMTIERTRAQEELSLAASIYNNISEAVLVSDAEHNIIACNPAFSQLTGYSLEAIRGKNPALLHSDRHPDEFFNNIWKTIYQKGFWRGEIWAQRKNGDVFLAWLTINAIHNESNDIQRYVIMGSDITSKVRSDELIWRQANYDFLTDLPNRYMFQDRLEQEIRKSIRQSSLLGLLFIDLDHFKDVNDTLGHAVGDQLLIQAAERINSCVRDSDTVARMGGDEFTVILPKLSSPLDGEKMAEKVISKLAEPYFIADETLHIQASIGISFCPSDTTDVDQLISNADQAMYASKTTGRNRLSYFTQALHDEARSRLKLLNDMRTAIENRQFELYYQPIINLSSGQPFKAEALLRWNHPELGSVQPAEFIPLAEESGLIVEIGNWVFQEAAGKAKYWAESLHFPLQISINMSPLQFQSAALNIPDWLLYLQNLGLETKCLNIEITEGLLLNVSEKVQHKLLQFRNAEIQIAIDDFGVGYSSLSSLRRFAIDHLKIDQSFIQSMETEHNNLVLCETIIMMAHKLGLQVTAEGIETEGQHRALLEYGCDHGQGFLYSAPLPATEFENYLINSMTSP